MHILSSRLQVISFFCLLMLVNTAEANWQIDTTGFDGGCALTTPAIVINDGHGDTRVQLKLNRQKLIVVTDSNIDNTKNDLGLTVDNKAFIRISEVSQETNVIFGREHIDSIIGQFIPGRRVLIQLRFWPTWPETGIKEVEFSLIGFTRTLEQLSQCE